MQSVSAVEPVLLWLDLTRDRSTPALMLQFAGYCTCRLTSGKAEVAREEARQADMICVHFDRPDANGLNLLLDIKRRYPSTPITMFTVQHSEELAIWAMRARVWEFVVVPMANAELHRYLESLSQLSQLRRTLPSLGRKPLLERNPPLPESIRLTAGHQKHKALSKVMPYIEQHFRDCLDQKELARQCGMTPFRFSRLFKEINGVGFMEYILGKRMDYAKHLLENSQMPVTSIGYEAGFKDPSYFARAFKQLAGCSPSEYRQGLQAPTPQDDSAPVVDQGALGTSA